MRSSPLSFWTRTLIIINTLVFLALAFFSKSLFTPDQSWLIAFGAKEPLLMAKGEWWRLITPLFIHIGMIHFTLNMMALKVIGSQIETILGGMIFLIAYLLCGIGGNIASSLGTLALSSGASGAIFGIIGIGAIFEYLISHKQKNSGTWFQKLCPGPFCFMVWLNMLISIVFNVIVENFTDWNIEIDNFAHLGGLFFGFVIGISFLSLKRNQLVKHRPILGSFLLLFLGAIIFFGLQKSTSPQEISHRFFAESLKTTDAAKQYYLLSTSLEISPKNYEARFARGAILAQHGELALSFRDFKACPKDIYLMNQLLKFHGELLQKSKVKEAYFIEKAIKEFFPEESL